MTFSDELKTICQNELSNYCSDTDDLRTAVIASTDGFAVADVSKKGSAATRLTALARSMYTLTASAGRDIALGQPETLILESAEGKTIMLTIPLPRQTLLFIACLEHSTPTGTALYGAKNCTRKIVEQLSHNVNQLSDRTKHQVTPQAAYS